MRLGTVTLSATLSAALLSGCSFIGGQSSGYENPYANQNAGQYGQNAYAQRCQIASPQQPIPRGCRAEQVTIGTAGQSQYSQNQYSQGGYGAHGGFPQQPQFGQPEYASGAYGAAVGHNQAPEQTARGPKKRKPKLRGSLSLGLEKSNGGTLLDFNDEAVGNPFANYVPGDFNQVSISGSDFSGVQTTTTFTANQAGTAIEDVLVGQGPLNGLDRVNTPSISFDDVWSTPASVKAGLEYIVNDKTTVFGNVGYTYAEGEDLRVGSATASIFEHTSEVAFDPTTLQPIGSPVVNVTSLLNSQEVARVDYNFSDLRQYDLEVGARRYFNPIVKSEGFRTVTPFVGVSVGASRVNAAEFRVSRQQQAAYDLSFADGTTEGNFFDVATDGTPTRISDGQWLPKGELNVGAEWQLTPGFALAAETGVRIQGERDYEDFTNNAGELVEGRSGDTNVSIPLTLRGSINF